MRKDPPFDLEYVASTWLLSAAVREGAKVFNAPDAIRDLTNLWLSRGMQFFPTRCLNSPCAVP